jgi:hypothetical protein
MRENWLDSVCNDFRDEFIAEIAKGNWPKINKSSRVLQLWDEGKKGRIQGANHLPFESRVLHKFQQVRTHQIKEMEIKFYSPAIRAWTFVLRKRFESNQDFWNCSKGYQEQVNPPLLLNCGKSLATVTVVCKFSICFASYKGLKCLIAADFNACCPLKMLPSVSAISQMCFLLLQELAKFVKKFGVKITIFNPVVSANLSPNGFFFRRSWFLSISSAFISMLLLSKRPARSSNC